MSVENLQGAIRQRLRELGISAREASRRAGFNVGYVGDILDGRSKRPDPEKILRLAKSLDMDAVDLLGDSPRAGDANPHDAEARTGARMIPVYSAPIPMLRQFVPFAKAPTGSMACPASLLEAADAFAAMVPSDSCAPRFRAGDTILVNPAATPAVGDYVFVRCEDDSVAIARLDSMDADSFELGFPGLEGDDAITHVRYDAAKAINRIVGALF